MKNYILKGWILIACIVSLSGCVPLAPSIVGWGVPSAEVGNDSTKKMHDFLSKDGDSSSKKSKDDTRSKSSLKLDSGQYTFYAKKSFKVINTRGNSEYLSVSSGQKFKALLNPVTVKGKSYRAICLADCKGAQRYIVGLVTTKGELNPSLYMMIARNKLIDYEATTLKITSKNVRFKVNKK